MSLEDVLAAKSALEMYESHMHDDPLGSLTEEPVMEEEQGKVYHQSMSSTWP